MPGRRVVVRRSPIHGRGLFALTPIDADAHVLDYAGELIDEDEAIRRHGDGCGGHTFFFGLGDGWVIDGGSGGNSSRWINHSCAPNVVAEVVGRRVLISAARDIHSGDELLLDYQLHAEFDSEEERAAYDCGCGAPECRGTMLSPETAATDDEEPEELSA